MSEPPAAGKPRDRDAGPRGGRTVAAGPGGRDAEAGPLVPPRVERVVPYVPGKPIEEVARELGLDPDGIVKLASNENPLGPSPRALAALREAGARAHLYPEGSGWLLRRALGERLGVPMDEIVLGSGTNDLIDLCVRSFCGEGDEVVTSETAFLCYRLACLVAGVPCREVPMRDRGFDLDAIAAAVTPRTKVVFVANPNNPTGTYLGRAAVERFLSRLPPRVVLVWDEAYFEYVDAGDYPDLVAWRGRRERLVVLRTFSKIHGLAGLRIGYAVAPPAIAGALHRVRLPFNTGSAAQAAARAALDDADHVRRSIEVNREGRALLAHDLPRLGARVTPSVANFVLADLGRPAAPVYQAMLRRGVIVRPVANYGLPDCLRITVGAPDQNARMLDALRAAL